MIEPDWEKLEREYLEHYKRMLGGATRLTINLPSEHQCRALLKAITFYLEKK